MIRKYIGLVVLIVLTQTMTAQVAITHTVKKGESIYGIAQKYGISTELLKQTNPEMGEYFYAGMVLNIPTKIVQSEEANYIDTAKVQNVYESPLTKSKIEGPQYYKHESAKIKDIINYGLMYWGFDGYENYGIFSESITYNGFGLEMSGRTKFAKHSNFNCELGLNYSLGIYRQENTAIMLTASVCPLSIRWQDEYYYETNKYIKKVFLDAYYGIRLSIKLGCVAITGGYFYWAPKWEHSSEYKSDGFCVGLMYSTKYK